MRLQATTAGGKGFGLNPAPEIRTQGETNRGHWDAPKALQPLGCWHFRRFNQIK